MNEVSLQHRQGDFQVEAHFSLDCPWTVLFGPSGAGKSSILRMLAGLMVPRQGRIVLGGRTLLDTAQCLSIPPGRRAIGFVTQQAALFPHLSVSDNVGFGIRHLPRDARTKRVGEMLHLFGAEQLVRRKTSELSGGERQRIALARALAPSPRLLLLDEPLSALDDRSAQDILSRLMALDLRVLYVSHDLPEIWQIPADVVLLHRGQVTSTGPLQQVLADYRNRLLQQLGL